MSTLLLTFSIMLLIVAAMAIGVMFGRKPISGSCGGVGQFGVTSECELCGGNPQRCEDARGG